MLEAVGGLGQCDVFLLYIVALRKQNVTLSFKCGNRLCGGGIVLLNVLPLL